MALTKKKKIWIACGGIALLGAVVFFSIRATRKDEVQVQTAKAQRKDVLKSKVAASGEIRAKEFVDLQAEVAGVITALDVHEGDTVKKGDVLLRIDPLQTRADTDSTKAQFDASSSEARAQEFQIMNAESALARDEAALRSSKAELEQAQYNNVRAQSSFKRKQQLHEDGLISREEYEMAQNDARAAQSQLEVAKARVSQQETQIQVSTNTIQQMKTSLNAAQSRAKSFSANLTRANDQLEKTVIRSPLSGVITNLAVEKGERAVPGMMFNPQATLMTIADLSVIQAELKVDETDIVNLQADRHGLCESRCAPGQRVRGGSHRDRQQPDQGQHHFHAAGSQGLQGHRHPEGSIRQVAPGHVVHGGHHHAHETERARRSHPGPDDPRGRNR